MAHSAHCKIQKLENLEITRYDTGACKLTMQYGRPAGLGYLEIILAFFLWIAGSVYSIAAVMCLVRVAYLLLHVSSESVFIVQDMGIVVSTERWGKSGRKFIPQTAIQRVVLNEGIRRWQTRYYLALVCTSDKPKVIADANDEGDFSRLEVLFAVFLTYTGGTPAAASAATNVWGFNELMNKRGL